MPVTIDDQVFADLEAAIKAAKPNDKLVVSGTVKGGINVPSMLDRLRIIGEAGAIVTSSGVPAITNAAPGLVISGITFKSEDAEACISVSGKDGDSVQIQACEMCATKGTGLKVEGCAVIMEGCTISGCGEYGLSSLGGATVSCSNVNIQGNAKTGVLSRGEKSSVSLCASTKVQKNGGNGVGCDQGGSVTLSFCKVLENKSAGINIAAGCLADISSSEVANSGMHGIVVNGGKLIARDITVRTSASLGMLVSGASIGHGAVEIWDSVFSGSGSHGIFVQFGGKLEAHGIEVSQAGQSGVVAMGGEVAINKSTISHNGFDGVHVGDHAQGAGGSAQVEGSQVTHNKHFGLSVMGAKSTLHAVDCKVQSNGAPAPSEGGHGICVLLGAKATATNCILSRNLKSGVLVHGSSPQGAKSRLELRGGAVEKNAAFGASVAEGGSLHISAGTGMRENVLGTVEGDYTRETGSSMVITVAAVAVAAVCGFVLMKSLRK